jgi:hypothetical protein
VLVSWVHVVVRENSDKISDSPAYAPHEVFQRAGDGELRSRVLVDLSGLTPGIPRGIGPLPVNHFAHGNELNPEKRPTRQHTLLYIV